jgi:hypothetical protein
MVAALEEIGKVDQSIATTLQAHLTIGSLPFCTSVPKNRNTNG